MRLWEGSHEASEHASVQRPEYCWAFAASSLAYMQTGTGSDLFGGSRGYRSVAAGALVVAAARPNVVPYGAAPVAFVVVDECWLAAGLAVPLVATIGLLLHFRIPRRSRSSCELLACVE